MLRGRPAALLLRRAVARGLASASRARNLFELLDAPQDTPAPQMRTLYLSALIETHPDHSKAPDAAGRMHELMEAWERYQLLRKRDPSDADGFATFGVGCSFCDNPAERAQRAELMEQASTGRMNQRAIRGRDDE